MGALSRCSPVGDYSVSPSEAAPHHEQHAGRERVNYGAIGARDQPAQPVADRSYIILPFVDTAIYLVARLKTLARLKESGHLTEEEFQAQKAKLLV
jgi:hypothetical protein